MQAHSPNRHPRIHTMRVSAEMAHAQRPHFRPQPSWIPFILTDAAPHRLFESVESAELVVAPDHMGIRSRQRHVWNRHAFWRNEDLALVRMLRLPDWHMAL